MAYKGKTIHNPKTGQSILFLQTAKDSGGKLLEMETTYNSYSIEPPAHYHPYQAEDFKVLAGTLTVKIDGVQKILKAGENLHIPANTVHAMWNGSQEKTLVHWQVQPASDTEYLLETGMGLAADNKTNENGMPGIFQVALMANQFSNVFRLAKPPFIIQKILFAILTPLALLSGYKGSYKKYYD